MPDRLTCEIFAAHWPFAGDDPMARKLNGATRYVASNTLERADWANTKLVSGDIACEIAGSRTAKVPSCKSKAAGN